MTFEGSRDVITTAGMTARIGPLISEHREELERMGWVVHLVDGFGHELGRRLDLVIPILAMARPGTASVISSRASGRRILVRMATRERPVSSSHQAIRHPS
jgi:hypothetical protein